MCSSPIETVGGVGALFTKSPSLHSLQATKYALTCLFKHCIKNEQHPQKQLEQYWNYIAQLELC